MNNNKNKKAPKMGKKKNGGARITAPVAQTRVMRTGVPKVSGSAYTSDGRVRVQHREYLADVNGSVNFAVTSYSVNPGLSSTFPWLAPIANQFESYLLRNLSIEFETQKSTATSGTVLLAIDYDASDAVPANKQQLMSYHDAVRSSVWNECCFSADTRDLQKFGVQRYIRSGALAANQDIKTFDVGNILIATQGCADATAIGELYVMYDIELITPQSDVSALALGESAKIVGAGTVNLANVYGTVSGTVTGGLPLTAVGGTITFNRVGQYIVEQICGGVGFAAEPTQTGTATVTAINGGVHITAAADEMVNSWIVKINNVGETLIINYTGHATSVANSVTRVGTYAYSLA
jgi:hypothetical protein